MLQLENVTFWLKSDIFEATILPHKPTSKISVGNLTRIYAYSKKSELSHISRGTWLKIACDKIKMGVSLAMLYFDLTWDFFASLEERKEYNEAKAESSDQQNVLDERSVMIQNIILVLFLQLFVVNPVSLKRCRSLERVSNQEKWPSSNPCTRSPTILSLTSREKILDDDVYVEFIKDRIEDLCKVFGEDCNTFSQVLQVIIGINCDLDEDVNWSILFENFLPNEICQTLKRKLGPNMFGVKACIKSGKRVSWPVGGFGNLAKTEEKPKMATNANKTEKHKLIVINQLTKKTVARKSTTLTDSHVKIHRCKESFIYLMTSLCSLDITKCSDTTIVTGPIRNNLNINRCSNVKIISIANRVIIGETFNSTLNVATPNQLIFNGETCRNVTLGPYNTNYVNLEGDLEKVAMLTIPTLVWKKPIVLTKDEIKINCRSAFPFKIMKAEAFSIFVVPFKGMSIRKDMFNPENEYKEIVKNRSELVKQWEEFKEQANLDNEQMKELEKHLNLKLKMWMSKSSNELLGLKSLLAVLD